MGKIISPFRMLQLLSIWTIIIVSDIPTCVSEIKKTRIQDDSRSMILFERFGFSEHGHVDVLVEGVVWKRTNQNAGMLNPSSMGFFLAKDLSFPHILNESEYSEHFCVLSSKYAKLVFRFETRASYSSYNGSVIVDHADEYNLVFGNCQPEYSVSMNVRTEMYNIEHGEKDFLPAGQTPLPKLYFFLFLIYSGFFGTWVFICLKQRATVGKVHVLMGALLLLKALKLICAYEDKIYIRKTGTPHGWDVAFYIFSFFKGVMLFTVIILIGTGWSFLKPYLQEREKQLLMMVIPLQVLANVAYVIIEETGPTVKEFQTWNQMFLLIDIICCCAVFLPVFWSIKSLKEASKTDGKAAKNLGKLQLFKQFYVVLIGYLYFTRVVVLALGSIVGYRYEWLMHVAAECASFALYVFIFYNFKPAEKNPYLAVDDEEESAAGQMLQEDESFEL